MKTLKQMLELYEPKAGDEKKFADKHVVAKNKLSKPTEDDKLFQATNIKTGKRAPNHGYDAGKDEEVYEDDQSHEIELNKTKNNKFNLKVKQDNSKDSKSNFGPAATAAIQQGEKPYQVAFADAKDKINLASNKKKVAGVRESKVLQKLSQFLPKDVRAVTSPIKSTKAAAKAVLYKELPVAKAFEETELAEAGMPSSVARHKQNLANMSDKDFYEKHKDHTEKDLQGMAWRHFGTKQAGPGTRGHSHYVNRHKAGKEASSMKEEVELDEADMYSIKNGDRTYYVSKYPITSNHSTYKKIKAADPKAQIHKNGQPVKEEVEVNEALYQDVASKYGFQHKATPNGAKMMHPKHGEVSVNQYGEWHHFPKGSAGAKANGETRMSLDKHLSSLKEESQASKKYKTLSELMAEAKVMKSTAFGSVESAEELKKHLESLGHKIIKKELATDQQGKPAGVTFHHTKGK